MAWKTRQDWTTSQRGCTEPFGSVKGVAIHYPGSNIPLAVAQGNEKATAKWLDGVRTSQMNSTEYEYCDIEYNFAVDRVGNIWVLRGMNRRTGANGTVPANEAYPSILVIVGLTNDEIPTAKQVFGIRTCIARIRKNYPNAKQIQPHQRFVPTACPGKPLLGMIQSGKLEPRDPVVVRIKARMKKLDARLTRLRDRLARRTSG
jgi:hypothetical protein